MGRTTVRNAIASYLNGAQINYVGQVYATRNYISEQDFEQRILNGALSQISSVNGSGCVIVVNLTEDQRGREVDTGRGAVGDTYVHTVALELFFANVKGDPSAAQLDYDSIVDGIIKSIRADATLGAPTVIWSAGEYKPWIHHSQTSPYTDSVGMTIHIDGVIRFDAWEWLSGSGV